MFARPKRLWTVSLAAGALGLFGGAAQAAVQDYPPSGGSSQSVAANAPVSFNIWTGVAQSFVTPDAHIDFGFYMLNPTAADEAVKFSLFSGDGLFTTLLGARSATVLGGLGITTQLVTVDFSAIGLSVGGSYTVEVSRPDGSLPPVGTYTSSYILYHSLADSYPGGRFYFTGASYDESFFAKRDIAFKITPVAGVPEPDAWVLMIAGFGIIGAVSRRRPTLA